MKKFEKLIIRGEKYHAGDLVDIIYRDNYWEITLDKQSYHYVIIVGNDIIFSYKEDKKV